MSFLGFSKAKEKETTWPTAWLRRLPHIATNQAITKGFKTGDIQRIVKEGSAVMAMGRYGPQTRYTLGGNTVVINAQGRVVTVYSNMQGTNKGLGKGLLIPFKN